MDAMDTAPKILGARVVALYFSALVRFTCFGLAEDDGKGRQRCPMLYIDAILFTINSVHPAGPAILLHMIGRMA